MAKSQRPVVMDKLSSSDKSMLFYLDHALHGDQVGVFPTFRKWALLNNSLGGGVVYEVLAD
jgi:hypothetical protein